MNKQPKCPFFLLFQPDWFKIAWLFHDGSYTKQQHYTYTEQWTSPSFFSQLRSLTRDFKPVTQQLWLHWQCRFLHLYACAQST